MSTWECWLFRSTCMCRIFFESFVSCTLARCFSMRLCACTEHVVYRSPLRFRLSARLQCTCVVTLCLFTSVFHFLVWLQFTWVVYTCVSSPLRKLWFSYSGDLCLSAKMPMAALAQTCYGSPLTYLHVVTWEVLSTIWEIHKHEHVYLRPIWVLLFVRFCSKNYVHCHQRCNFNPIVALVLNPFWNLNAMQFQNSKDKKQLKI